MPLFIFISFFSCLPTFLETWDAYTSYGDDKKNKQIVVWLCILTWMTWDRVFPEVEYL